MNFRRMFALVFSICFLGLVPAFAHTGAGSTVGFWHGAEHPISGLDHILAMVTVGLWAAQLRGRALWGIPLAFVGAMALGGALGMMGVAVPFVEGGIVLSVLLLGFFVATSLRLPLPLSAVIVGIFAIFHGNAHGLEMPETASGLLYGAGFIISTAVLHMVGIGLGVGMQRLLRAPAVRLVGGAVALGSIYLYFA